MMTIANRITLLRAFLTILMYACIVVPASWTRLAALLIFAIASITDWIDGFLARRTNTTTTFGAVADPFVDKLLIGGVFVAFASVPALNVPLWAVFLIIARELTISTLRVLAALNREVLSAERSGKFKTAIQMISASIILIILNIQDLAVNGPLDWQPAMQGTAHLTAQFPYVLTIIVMLITWASGISYLYNHWDMLSRSWSIPQNRRPSSRHNGAERRAGRHDSQRHEAKLEARRQDRRYGQYNGSDDMVQKSAYFSDTPQRDGKKRQYRPYRRNKRPARNGGQGQPAPQAPAAPQA